MSIEEIVEKKIRDAMALGEFDNLSGQGKPQDHSAYFATPEDQRMAYTVLKNAGYLPHEVQLLKDVAELQERLAASREQAEQQKLRRAIHDKRLEFDVLMERRNRRPRPARRATR